MTKKELESRAKELTRTIRNLRIDYSGVHPDDMPDEVTEELRELLTKLTGIRAKLGKEQ